MFDVYNRKKKLSKIVECKKKKSILEIMYRYTSLYAHSITERTHSELVLHIDKRTHPFYLVLMDQIISIN